MESLILSESADMPNESSSDCVSRATESAIKVVFMLSALFCKRLSVKKVCRELSADSC